MTAKAKHKMICCNYTLALAVTLDTIVCGKSASGRFSAYHSIFSLFSICLEIKLCYSFIQSFFRILACKHILYGSRKLIT